MLKKIVVAGLVAAAMGCAGSGDEDPTAEVVRRYTCFGGDYVVTVYADITMTATCSTFVDGQVQHVSLDFAGANLSVATCDVGGTRYTLFQPLAVQAQIRESDLAPIRNGECDVYVRNTDTE